MKFLRLAAMLTLAFIVSMYVFPIEFRFLPAGLNTKKILGVLGIMAYMVDAFRRKAAIFHNTTVISLLIAIVFSLWCYFTMVANGTPDDTYATYIVSFSVWLGGAYAVCALVRGFHGRINLPILVQYLAFACVFQCIMALVISSSPAVRSFVDHFIQQGQDFLKEVDRLYGIGASLDPAGCRFSVILVLIAHLISTENRVTDSKVQLVIALAAFFTIVLVGNMISRTTIAGTALGLGYIFFRLGTTRKGVLSRRKIRFYGILLPLLLVIIIYTIFEYRSGSVFRENLRFAFEAFFNYFERGEFKTDSTEKLKGTMWIWPTNFHDWMIGTGWFGFYVYATDIGYCRFILYCGIIGMVIFSSFFIYNSTVVIRKFRDSRILAILLIALTFIIWVKVATDIFWIYAILFCLPTETDDTEALTDSQG